MAKVLDFAAVILVTLFLLLLAFGAILGVLDPYKASAGYGMPVSDAAGALFYRVFASRNLVIIAAGFIFLFLRMWKPLAILVSLTLTLALFDIAILRSESVSVPALHPIALVLIVVTAALLWRRARSAAALRSPAP